MRAYQSWCIVLSVVALAAPLKAEEITLSTAPTGAQEVPGPGDPKGSGTVSLKLDPAKENLCFDIALQSSEPPTAAHIHTGAAGVAGTVVVGLATPQNGSAKGCTAASRELLEKLSKNPENYYFNVHTATYKAGALRGQLARSVPAQ